MVREKNRVDVGGGVSFTTKFCMIRGKYSDLLGPCKVTKDWILPSNLSLRTRTSKWRHRQVVQKGKQ